MIDLPKDNPTLIDKIALTIADGINKSVNVEYENTADSHKAWLVGVDALHKFMEAMECRSNFSDFQVMISRSWNGGLNVQVVVRHDNIGVLDFAYNLIGGLYG